MISWSRVDQQGKTLNKNRGKQTLKKKGFGMLKKNMWIKEIILIDPLRKFYCTKLS